MKKNKKTKLVPFQECKSKYTFGLFEKPKPLKHFWCLDDLKGIFCADCFDTIKIREYNKYNKEYNKRSKIIYEDYTNNKAIKIV